MCIRDRKMLHPITAAGNATVASVEVAAGDQVDGNGILITFSESDPTTPPEGQT